MFLDDFQKFYCAGKQRATVTISIPKCSYNTTKLEIHICFSASRSFLVFPNCPFYTSSILKIKIEDFVQGPDRLELTFFRAACTGLCFRFAAEPGLITQRCCGCWWPMSRPPRFPLYWPKEGQAGVGGKTAQPAWPQGCSMPNALMFSKKNWRKGSSFFLSICCTDFFFF